MGMFTSPFWASLYFTTPPHTSMKHVTWVDCKNLTMRSGITFLKN